MLAASFAALSWAAWRFRSIRADIWSALASRPGAFGDLVDGFWEVGAAGFESGIKLVSLFTIVFFLSERKVCASGTQWDTETRA